MTLLDYLKQNRIDPQSSIVEVNGTVYPVGADFAAVDYHEGDRVEAFRIVSGG